MPGYQNTFTLITERVAPVTDEPVRMTSKQVKKAHKASNKAPKLSRAEQRKLELAEQERIRKEIEKDRQANRARLAREKKKAKEDKEKEERRKKGRPLVDVRPSQDTIARFVRVDGMAMKRNAGEGEVARMASVVEEEPDTKEKERGGQGIQDHTDASLRSDSGPRPETEREHKHDGMAESNLERAIEVQPECEVENGNETLQEVVLETISQDGSGHLREHHSGNDVAEEPKENHAGSKEASTPSRSNRESGTPKSTRLRAESKISHRHPGTPQVEHHATTLDIGGPETSGQPNIVSASQSFWDDGVDDDLLQGLEATDRPDTSRRGESGEQERDMSFFGETSCGAPNGQRFGALLSHQSDDFDDLEDDAFALIQTQFVGQGSWQAREAPSPQEPIPALRPSGPVVVAGPEAATEGSFNVASDDEDALEALEAMFERYSPHMRTTNIQQLNNEEPPMPPPTGKVTELSSFAEEDLDDALLRQLDVGTELGRDAAETTADPVMSTIIGQDSSPPPLHQPPSQAVDEAEQPLEGLMPPAAAVHRPPLSTQAFLSNIDNYFPSPSQQERELDNFDDLLKTQSTPCPPPKKSRSQSYQQRAPEPSPQEQRASQKRFFSASGSNELLSLAIHRSKRDAVWEDFRRKEEQRFEAGKVKAKQAVQPGRKSTVHRQESSRPSTSLGLKPPRPAGKPPAWVANENVEPPPKRQKMTRTESQARPPVFKQPNAALSRAAPKPPPFKPKARASPTAAGKENSHAPRLPPPASQGSDYDGDWIDEVAEEMASAGRGCLSATQMVMDRGSGVWIR